MCETLYAKPSDRHSTAWIDIKVFYARISAAEIDDNAPAFPESLTVHCLPRGDGAIMEVNGRRIRASASAFFTLRRSSAEGNRSGDVAYVGTHNIRTTGDLHFEIYARDETLISGALKKKKKMEEFRKEVAGEGFERATWAVECSCALDYSSRWATTNSSFPAMEVYIAGRISGFPAILTETVQLIPRRTKWLCRGRNNNNNGLDAIPEGNENECSCDSDSNSMNLMDYKLYECGSGNAECMRWGEEHEFSWLVGIGIGIGVGMGIGIGLLFTTPISRRTGLLKYLLHL